MRNKINKLLLVGAFCAVFPLAGATTVGELDKIQAELILLKARTKLQEAKNTLDAKLPKSGDSVNAAESRPLLPVIRSIVGVNTKMTVTFVYENNVRVSAVVGEALPDGFVLHSVDPANNKAEIRRGKESYIVGMSTVTPSSQPQQTNGFGGYPSMAPPMMGAQ